jgi:hypothetical protein
MSWGVVRGIFIALVLPDDGIGIVRVGEDVKQVAIVVHGHAKLPGAGPTVPDKVLDGSDELCAFVLAFQIPELGADGQAFPDADFLRFQHPTRGQ